MRIHYSDRHYKNILQVQHCDSVSYNTAGDSYSLELFPVNSRKLCNKIRLQHCFSQSNFHLKELYSNFRRMSFI